jgi:hypothetical protein
MTVTGHHGGLARFISADISERTLRFLVESASRGRW